MVFVSPDLAEGVLLTGAEVVDGVKNTEANLNDDNTSTTATNEWRFEMGGYKLTHDLGFAVADIDTMSIRVFDGSIMDEGVCRIYPYQSDDANVNTGNFVDLFINDNGAYDTVVASAGFIGDLEDVGVDQISIRFAWTDPARGRFTELQIEFAEAVSVPLLRRYEHMPAPNPSLRM